MSARLSISVPSSYLAFLSGFSGVGGVRNVGRLNSPVTSLTREAMTQIHKSMCNFHPQTWRHWGSSDSFCMTPRNRHEIEHRV